VPVQEQLTELVEVSSGHDSDRIVGAWCSTWVVGGAGAVVGDGSVGVGSVGAGWVGVGSLGVGSPGAGEDGVGEVDEGSAGTVEVGTVPSVLWCTSVEAGAGWVVGTGTGSEPGSPSEASNGSVEAGAVEAGLLVGSVLAPSGCPLVGAVLPGSPVWVDGASPSEEGAVVPAESPVAPDELEWSPPTGAWVGGGAFRSDSPAPSAGRAGDDHGACPPAAAAAAPVVANPNTTAPMSSVRLPRTTRRLGVIFMGASVHRGRLDGDVLRGGTVEWPCDYARRGTLSWS
jgi:hypothetical protein